MQTVKQYLKQGLNDIEFHVNGSKIECNLYFWDYSEKIVISDIDGTVTNSDMLGHLFPRFGIEWAHSGIANLYSNIYKNGYKMLYLSSRPIGFS